MRTYIGAKVLKSACFVLLLVGCGGNNPDSGVRGGDLANGGGDLGGTGADGDMVGGGDSADPLPHCNATDPRSVAPVVYPTPEAGEAPYVDALMSAQKSIRVEIYEMGVGGILTALEAQAKAGVSVRMILDKSEISTNQKYFDDLVQAGVQVEWSDPQFTYQHAKFFVIDERVAVLSTGNYS